MENNEFTPIQSQEELDKLVEVRLNEQKEILKKEMENTIAKERKRYEDKYKKDVEYAKLTAEEREKAIAEDVRKQELEEKEALKRQVEELTLRERNSLINSKLLEHQLPKRYLHDARLSNSTDIDATIKVLYDEYQAEKSEILKNSIHTTSPSNTNNTTNNQVDSMENSIRKGLGI